MFSFFIFLLSWLSSILLLLRQKSFIYLFSHSLLCICSLTYLFIFLFIYSLIHSYFFYSLTYFFPFLFHTTLIGENEKEQKKETQLSLPQLTQPVNLFNQRYLFVMQHKYINCLAKATNLTNESKKQNTFNKVVLWEHSGRSKHVLLLPQPSTEHQNVPLKQERRSLASAGFFMIAVWCVSSQKVSVFCWTDFWTCLTEITWPDPAFNGGGGQLLFGNLRWFEFETRLFSHYWS